MIILKTKTKEKERKLCGYGRNLEKKNGTGRGANEKH